MYRKAQSYLRLQTAHLQQRKEKPQITRIGNSQACGLYTAVLPPITSETNNFDVLDEINYSELILNIVHLNPFVQQHAPLKYTSAKNKQHRIKDCTFTQHVPDSC